jgi:hypothetical protein
MSDESVLLDLNSPVFQRDLFALNKADQNALLSSLKRIKAMTWQQVYSDSGLKWEAIHSRQGHGGKPFVSVKFFEQWRIVRERGCAF